MANKQLCYDCAFKHLATAYVLRQFELTPVTAAEFAGHLIHALEHLKESDVPNADLCGLQIALQSIAVWLTDAFVSPAETEDPARQIMLAGYARVAHAEVCNGYASSDHLAKVIGSLALQEHSDPAAREVRKRYWDSMVLTAEPPCESFPVNTLEQRSWTWISVSLEEVLDSVYVLAQENAQDEGDVSGEEKEDG